MPAIKKPKVKKAKTLKKAKKPAKIWRKKSKIKVKSPKKCFRWVAQKLDGDDGESFMLKCYDRLVKSEDKSVDFYLGSRSIELKTDSYRMNENPEGQKFTPNFFFERIGNLNRGILTGVWGSKADYFVYLFIKDKTFFWFKTKELRNYLDAIFSKLKAKTIWNKGYDSIGYILPRKDLAHLVFLEECFQGYVD